MVKEGSSIGQDKLHNILDNRSEQQKATYRPPALLVQLHHTPLRLGKVIASACELPPHERAPPVGHNTVEDVLLRHAKAAQFLQRQVDAAAARTAESRGVALANVYIEQRVEAASAKARFDLGGDGLAGNRRWGLNGSAARKAHAFTLYLLHTVGFEGVNWEIQ